MAVVRGRKNSYKLALKSFSGAYNPQSTERTLFGWTRTCSNQLTTLLPLLLAYIKANGLEICRCIGFGKLQMLLAWEISSTRVHPKFLPSHASASPLRIIINSILTYYEQVLLEADWAGITQTDLAMNPSNTEIGLNVAWCRAGVSTLR